MSSVYGFFLLSFIHAISQMLNCNGIYNTIAQPQIYLPDARTSVDSMHLSISQVRPRQTRLLRATRHSSRVISRDSCRLFAADAQTMFLGNGPIDRYLLSDLVRQVSAVHVCNISRASPKRPSECTSGCRLHCFQYRHLMIDHINIRIPFTIPLWCSSTTQNIQHL